MEQATKEPVSSLHSKLRPPSLPVNGKLAAAEVVRPEGPPVIETVASASIVKLVESAVTPRAVAWIVIGPG